MRSLVMSASRCRMASSSLGSVTSTWGEGERGVTRVCGTGV